MFNGLMVLVALTFAGVAVAIGPAEVRWWTILWACGALWDSVIAMLLLRSFLSGGPLWGYSVSERVTSSLACALMGLALAVPSKIAMFCVIAASAWAGGHALRLRLKHRPVTSVAGT